MQISWKLLICWTLIRIFLIKEKVPPFPHAFFFYSYHFIDCRRLFLFLLYFLFPLLDYIYVTMNLYILLSCFNCLPSRPVLSMSQWQQFLCIPYNKIFFCYAKQNASKKWILWCSSDIWWLVLTVAFLLEFLVYPQFKKDDTFLYALDIILVTWKIHNRYRYRIQSWKEHQWTWWIVGDKVMIDSWRLNIRK